MFTRHGRLTKRSVPSRTKVEKRACPVLSWLLGAEEKQGIVLLRFFPFSLSFLLLQLYIHTYAKANADASMYVQAPTRCTGIRHSAMLDTAVPVPLLTE